MIFIEQTVNFLDAISLKYSIQMEKFIKLLNSIALFSLFQRNITLYLDLSLPVFVTRLNISKHQLYFTNRVNRVKLYFGLIEIADEFFILQK